MGPMHWIYGVTVGRRRKRSKRERAQDEAVVTTKHAVLRELESSRR